MGFYMCLKRAQPKVRYEMEREGIPVEQPFTWLRLMHKVNTISGTAHD